jgi:hypothetical protein
MKLGFYGDAISVEIHKAHPNGKEIVFIVELKNG